MSDPSVLRAVVRVLWDSEARVWVATSEDVPGLVCESADMDNLVAEVRDLVPELLDANGLAVPAAIHLHFLADRLETLAA